MVVLCLFVTGCLGLSCVAMAGERRVLVLYSYHDSSAWQRLLRKGLHDELESAAPDKRVILFEEHVDAGRLDEKQAMASFKSYISRKYAGVNFDAVAADDLYANTILHQNPSLFPNAHRYYIDPALGNAWHPQDGVSFNTKAQYDRALKTVIQIAPHLHRLIVVMDKSQLGQFYTDQWKRLVYDYRNKLEIEIFDDFSVTELIEKSKHLPPDTAIFYLPVFHDKIGAKSNPLEICAQLAKVASAPIFVHHDTFMGTGVVGGFIRSAERIGHIMGKFLLGQVTDPALLEDTAFLTSVDYAAMSRFGLDIDNLPPDTIIINRQPKIWETYFWEIVVGIIVLLAESMLIVFLLTVLNSRRRALFALNRTRAMLEQKVLERTQNLSEALNFNKTILLNSPLPIGVYAANGQCILANEAYAKIAGTTRDALLEQNFNNIASWQASGLLQDCLAALKHYTPRHREIKVVNCFGKKTWVDCQILPTRLNGEYHLLMQFTDLTERKQMEEKLRHIAFHDSLTRLPNRRLLLDRLKKALRNSSRQNSHVAVLFLDLNKFKQLNDSHGHDVGDRLLIEVAHRLQQLVRDNDTVARLGGDEFVVLLEGLSAIPEQAAEQADVIATKIRSALSEEYIFGDIRHLGSASIGIKLFLGDQGDPDQILKEADAAMYEAKKGLAG